MYCRVDIEACVLVVAGKGGPLSMDRVIELCEWGG